MIGESCENTNILRRAAMQCAWQTGEAARTTGGEAAQKKRRMSRREEDADERRVNGGAGQRAGPAP